MSFQNFRLQATTSQQPPAAPTSAHDPVSAGSLLHAIPTLNVHQQPPQASHQVPKPTSLPDPINEPHHHAGPSQPSNLKDNQPRVPGKAPYGSGDAEDGYTMVFESMAAFERWREQEEETKMVEFVKGDTHGSKAIPPRFKDHTKLVCARHQRSGRKKYVKKYPDRQRKVPSRKLEGMGCPASISYKTYFNTEEVRVMYNDHHSHDIGESNLPFTRRGRRLEVARQKYKANEGDDGYDMQVSMNARQNGMPNEGHSAPSTSHAQTHTQLQTSQQPQPPPPQPQPPQQHQGHPGMAMAHTGMAPGMPILSPLQNQLGGPGQSTGQEAGQDRWDRLEVLFQSARNHARGGYDYPNPSVAALESVLIRLYLESPVRTGQAPQAGMGMSGGGFSNS